MFFSEAAIPPLHAIQEAKRGLGTSAVFIARNRFAVLDRVANTIQIRNLQNEITKKCAPPCATTDAVFYAGTGTLLCRSEDKVGGSLEDLSWMLHVRHGLIETVHLWTLVVLFFCTWYLNLNSGADSCLSPPDDPL